MKNIIYLALIIFVSCAEKRIPNETFTDIVKMEVEPYDVDLITYPPMDLFLIDEELLAVESDQQHVLQKINKNTGESNGFWGGRGSGPGEYISPRFIGFSPDRSSFMIYDFNLRRLREYQTTNYSLVKEIKLKRTKDITSYTNIRQIDDNYYIASIIFGEGKPLRVLDKQLNIVSEFGDLKGVEGENYPLDGNARMDAYKGSFVYAMRDMGYLAFYNLKDGKPHLQWDWYAEDPIYRSPHDLDTSALLGGFSEIKITKDFIFCGYRGQKPISNKDTSAKTILVFDHKGKAIKRIEFDFRFGRFEVTQDQKTIYLISNDTELFKIDISNVL